MRNVVVYVEGDGIRALVVQGDRLKEWKRLAQAGDDSPIQILADAPAEAVASYDDVSRRHGVAVWQWTTKAMRRGGT